MCFSGLKFAPAEYATNAFSSKYKYEKLDVVVHVLQTTQNLAFSRCCFAEDGKENVPRIITHVHSHCSAH